MISPKQLIWLQIKSFGTYLPLQLCEFELLTKMAVFFECLRQQVWITTLKLGARRRSWELLRPNVRWLFLWRTRYCWLHIPIRYGFRPVKPQFSAQIHQPMSFVLIYTLPINSWAFPMIFNDSLMFGAQKLNWCWWNLHSSWLFHAFQLISTSIFDHFWCFKLHLCCLKPHFSSFQGTAKR